MNLKKILTGAAAGVLMLGTSIVPAFAAPSVNHSATGLIDYYAGGLERIANFNVKQTDKDCSTIWKLDGKYIVSFLLTGSATPYPYDVTLDQNGSKVSVSGRYPAGGPYVYQWTSNGKTGTVTGNTFSLTVHYTKGAINTVMNLAGTINPDGTISGTWTDNYNGGTRTGTWSTTTGHAKAVGCEGKGNFNYADANGGSYMVNVSCVYVNGHTATFSGKVYGASTSSWNGQYLIGQAVDNSPDTIAGSFVSSDPHCNTANLGGSYNVIFGNIIVK